MHPPGLSDFWVSFVAAIVVYTGEKVFVNATWTFFYNNVKQKKDEELRLKKTRKASEKMYYTIYFSLVTYYGYYVLSKSDFLPPMMGGKAGNDMVKQYINFPVIDDPEYG